MPSNKNDFDDMSDRDLMLFLCSSSAKQSEQISGLKETLNRHLSHHWASYLAVGTVVLGFVLSIN